MKLTNVTSRFGAPMGRRGNITEAETPIRLHLRHCWLNSGGYDNGGAYWGSPNDLWRAWGDGPTEVQEMFTRAPSRELARFAVQEIFPRVTFWR